MNKTKKECLGVPRPKKSGSDPSGLRFARDRFSAPPAIDVEKIMEVVKTWEEYDTRAEHGGADESEYMDLMGFYLFWSDLRSRLLFLLSPGKGEGKDEGVPGSKQPGATSAASPRLKTGSGLSATIADAPTHMPIAAVHNKAKTVRELEEARVKLKGLSPDQLRKLLSDTKFVNVGVKDAAPWIRIIEEEIAIRPGSYTNDEPA